tara:strand:+ start:2793 stop:3035 length:243 start_codon:yes stop_codon:yes gene_type:complete
MPSFTCPLCREEWLIVNKLCPTCDKVRHIMTLYSPKVVIETLEKIFLIKQLKEDDEELNKYIKVNGKWILKEEEQEKLKD